MPLSLKLPILEAKNTSAVRYEVQYTQKVVERMAERSPRGLIEKFEHWLDKDKIFYRYYTETEEIAIGDNFKSFLDAHIESLRPEVKAHVSAVIERMASACINPMLECYQKLDKQLEELTDKLENLRFSE